MPELPVTSYNVGFYRLHLPRGQDRDTYLAKRKKEMSHLAPPLSTSPLLRAPFVMTVNLRKKLLTPHQHLPLHDPPENE